MELRLDFDDEIKRLEQGAPLYRTLKEVEDGWPKDDDDDQGGEAMPRVPVPAGR